MGFTLSACAHNFLWVRYSYPAHLYGKMTCALMCLHVIVKTTLNVTSHTRNVITSLFIYYYAWVSFYTTANSTCKNYNVYLCMFPYLVFVCPFWMELICSRKWSAGPQNFELVDNNLYFQRLSVTWFYVMLFHVYVINVGFSKVWTGYQTLVWGGPRLITLSHSGQSRMLLA